MSPTATNHKRVSNDRHVHRQLVVTSPLMKGPDVKAFQQSLNHLADHYEFDWRQILVDGDFGRRTLRLAYFVGWCIGLSGDRLEVIKNQRRVPEEIQRLIRNPEKRSRQDRQREEARRPKMQKLRREHNSLRDSVEWMIKQKGTSESPPFSNTGPFPIDECQLWYGIDGVPWCGCFVGYAIEKISLGGHKTGTWWPHAAYIKGDALAGRNGLEDINPLHADYDCVGTLFNGGDDHVVRITGKPSGGLLPTVEGNTSSAKQDSDGGIIETKQRPASEFTIVARLHV